MTSLQEFIDAFNTRFYAGTTVNSLGWEDSEICEFLNSSQLKLVDEYISKGQLEDISELIKVEDDLVASLFGGSATQKTYTIDISSLEWLAFVSGEVYLTKDAVESLFELEKIDILEVDSFKARVDNVTFFRKPKIAVGSNGGKLYIVIDSYSTISNPAANIKYVSKPTEFNTSGSTYTNLNTSLHDKIVDIAVQMAISTVIKTGQSTQ